MDFNKAITRLHEEGLVSELELRIQEWIDQAQTQLDDGEGNDLHRAQGAKKELLKVLALPEEILEEHEAEKKQGS
jgi:hypothetical protein